ncbi:GntR family transcriptional regulator, partial [Bosea sp. (in: a-proteobacteria)]
MSLRSVLEADAYDDHGAAPQPALSLTEIAYRRLEEAIVTLSLRPGAVLTEAQLIDMVGVGRTPVREALIRLAQQGLVEVLPRKGVVVAGINAIDIMAALDAREVL